MLYGLAVVLDWLLNIGGSISSYIFTSESLLSPVASGGDQVVYVETSDQRLNVPRTHGDIDISYVPQDTEKKVGLASLRSKAPFNHWLIPHPPKAVLHFK